jgi:hypothetical protein
LKTNIVTHVNTSVTEPHHVDATPDSSGSDLFLMAYFVKIKKNVHFDAAPAPARKLMVILAAPVPQH